MIIRSYTVKMIGEYIIYYFWSFFKLSDIRVHINVFECVWLYTHISTHIHTEETCLQYFLDIFLDICICFKISRRFYSTLDWPYHYTGIIIILILEYISSIPILNICNYVTISIKTFVVPSKSRYWVNISLILVNLKQSFLSHWNIF